MPTDKHKAIGVAAAQPASGSVSVETKSYIHAPFFHLTFTLNKARIPVTDGAGSGSYGSLKLWDFVEGAIAIFGSRQNYTAFVEGSALTTGAGDAVHVLGVGSAAAATARDGTLTTTEQDIGAVTAQITNSGGTGVLNTKLTGALATPLDGTAAAKSLYLNWSGTAASIDANSTIDVTGTITVTGVLLSDD